MAPIPQPASAEDSFQRGLTALENRRLHESVSFFQMAIDLDRQDGGAKNPRMRYVSYLGLALTLAYGRSEEGQKLCEQAVRRDFFDADLYCNLGIVSMRNRRRGQAFEAFRKGLNLKPGHPRIRIELERHERRDRPVFPFLARNHFLNRLAGRLRYRFRLLFDSDASENS